MMISFFIFLTFNIILNTYFEMLQTSIKEIISSYFTPEALDQIIKSVNKSTTISFWIISVIFGLIFIIIQFGILINFKSKVLEMRRGIYSFDINKYQSYDALNTIGGFIANSFFSYNVFFIFMAILITPFCFSEFYALLWYFRAYWLNKVILILVNTVIHLILGKVMTDGTHYRFRTCYQFYEFYKILDVTGWDT